MTILSQQWQYTFRVYTIINPSSTVKCFVKEFIKGNLTEFKYLDQILRFDSFTYWTGFSALYVWDFLDYVQTKIRAKKGNLL